MQYGFSPKAYGKIVFHCAKYPHQAVNGVILGSLAKKENRVIVQDSIPLFHNDLDLTLMLEISLSQVEVYAASKGLSIIGYYYASHTTDDSGINLTEAAKAVGNKVFANTEQSCILLIDNKTIFSSTDGTALKVFTRNEQSSSWKENPKILSIDGGVDVVRSLLKGVQNGLHKKLVDFDSHLDSVDCDWTNPTINAFIEEQSNQ